MTLCSPPSRRGLSRQLGVATTFATASLDGVCAQRPAARAGRDEETVRGRTKRLIKSRAGRPPFPSQGGGERGHAALPWGAAGNHRVGEDQQLAHARDDRNVVLLAGGGEALVERDQLLVPMEGGRQSRGVEAGAPPPPAAGEGAGHR